MEKRLQEVLEKRFHKTLDTCTKEELFHALMEITKEATGNLKRNEGSKKLYYISAEFLIGKLLSNNLINLGLYEETEKVLKSHGYELCEIEELEMEPSLGNGGLGRLAACFLDSIATLGLPGDGIGLNYHFGLFQQKFTNHKQQELKNPWITKESWLNRQSFTCKVPFKDFTMDGVLYDIDVPGYDSGCNRLHLFDVDTIDESIVPENSIDFNKKKVQKNLTLFLYPDDSDDAGRKLRIYQQYFMVSCGAQLILKEMEDAGYDLHELNNHAVIQINDTHPSMVIPELIRLLTEEKGFTMDEAVEVVSKTCAYTNHTILAEALEKWPMEYLEEVVPNLVPIIKELDESRYQPDSWAALAQALAEAEKVAANRDATADEIEAAYTKLEAAYKALALRADMTAIDDMISKVEAMDANAHTAKSWKLVADALEAAKTVAANENATQEAVDAAARTLQAAAAALVKAGDATELNALVEETKQLDLSKYTVESADAIRQAISDAEAAIAGRASAEDLKAALDAVRNAVNTAQTKPAAPVQKPADTVKPVQKPADTVKDEHPDIAGGIANGTWGAAPTAKPNDGSAAASGSGATSAIPQTSDNFPYEVLSILACLAVGGFIVALYLKKRSGNR